MLAQLKVIIFFFAKLDLSPLRAELAVRTAFFVGQELFLTNRVVAGLFILVDLTLIEEPLQNALNDFLVAVTRCLSPFIVSDIKLLPKIDEFLRDAL